MFLTRNGRRSALGMALAAMLVAFGVGPAHALTLSLVGGDAAVVPASFDLNAETSLSTGDPLTVLNSANDFDSSGSTNGLFLDAAANLTFEFLGSEASRENTFSVTGLGQLFTNAGGATTTALFAAGIIPFSFATEGGTEVAANDGSIFPGLSIAFADITPTSVILLFGNGAGDADFDDLAVKVSVSPVPLPPAVWLFLSAILGLVSFSRIRRSERTA